MDLSQEQVASLTYKPQAVLLKVLSYGSVIVGALFWLAYLYIDQSFSSVREAVEHNDQRVAELVERVAKSEDKIDRQRESLIAVVEKKDDKIEQRLQAIDETVGKVDEKVDSVDKEVSSVDGKATVATISASVADSKSDEVEAEIAVVKTEVEKIGSDLTEASSELEGLITVLAITFPDEPALAILADKRASLEQPPEFFDEAPDSAALTEPSTGTTPPTGAPSSRAGKTIAQHCLRAGKDVIACYQRYLDKLPN